MLFQMRYYVLFRQFRLLTAQAGSIPAAIRLILKIAIITNNSITGRLEKQPPRFDVSRICLYENRQSANHNQFSPCG